MMTKSAAPSDLCTICFIFRAPVGRERICCDDNEGGGGGALNPSNVNPPPPAPPAPPAPAPAPAPAPPAPKDDEELRFTPESFAKRQERDRKAFLKSLGYESEEQAKKAREDAEAARLAKLTDEQKAAEERTRLQNENAELRRKAQEAEFSAQLTTVCVSLGITDVEYARYEVEKASKGQDTFDAHAFLTKKIAEDPRAKAKLGIAEPAAPPAPPVVRSVPVISSPIRNGNPPPAPANPNAPEEEDVSKMTDEQFRAYRQRKHGF